MISDNKLSVLRCPVCAGDLAQEEPYLICINCNTKFPVIENIVIFLTKADLDSFLNETWGNELDNENAAAFPGFRFVSNEDSIEDLRKIYEEATDEGKTTRLFNTGAFPQDPDQPEDLNRAIEKSRDEVVKLSRATSAKRVLDWPTGWGYCMHYLANQIDPETLLVSLDVNYRTLAKMKPYYDKNGLSDRILYVVADARKMPFKDGVFQSVTAWGGVTEIEKPDAGFRETYRVLGDNGWFAVSGDQYNEGSPSMKIAERMGFDPLVTRDRLESAMKDYGFRALDYKVLYEGYDTDLDAPEEDRCPLPARGDWFQIIAASAQK